MKRLFQIAVLMATIFVAIPVQALQNYYCDFENQADRDRWVLNPAANATIYSQLKNKWYIGAPGNNDKTGSYGLYVSDDEGATAHYSSNGCWLIAYDIVSLDHLSTNDDYILTFDYCGMGNVASNFDGIYVLWIPMVDPDTGDSVKVGSIAASSGIPAAYENYVVTLQPKANMDYVGGSQTWKQCEAAIKNKKCDGKPHYLAFVWANTANQTQQPGAMVDNIAILDTRPCDAPAGLTLSIQGTTSLLSWVGTSAEYEVSAYSYETETWFGPKIVTGNTTSFSNLPIGQTDFIVRAKCAEGLYSLKTSISKLVYYPDQMCVDYLNLETAKCYTGTGFSSSNNFNNYILGPAVDDGPAQGSSRHTIHFDKMERDVHTEGLLPTIPDGELASVRLGNWEGGNQTERIEYSFNVDTIDYSVLLLKYAPVFENGSGHDDDIQSRFKLDIRIGNNSIGECGQADFNVNSAYANGGLKPGAAEQGWHLTPAAKANLRSADVVWKEWTTVGVNLKKPEYQGKKLTVRLTTFDCAQTAHAGYAYFTLSCSDGKLKGMKCGEVNPVFEAPDGFVYRWAYASSEKYRLPDGTLPEQYVLGHEQHFEAGYQDDSLYVVDCMFVQDSSCFFSLYASTLATNPVAIMQKPAVSKSCATDKYHVQLDGSQSWVQEIDHVKGDTLESSIYHIDSYEWNIEGLPGGWSDEPAPAFDFPSSGGTYPITLRVTSGTCDSTVHYTLHLDELKETRDTVSVTLCDDVRKAGYQWSEKPDTAYFDYGTDSVVLFNAATSCDSIIYLILKEPVRIYEDTLVLPESLPFAYHGRSYTQNTLDTVPVSQDKCDTTWILNFEIYESLLVNMPQTSYILCGGDKVLNLEYDITRGRSLRFSYSFSDSAIPSISPAADVQRKGHYVLPIAIDPELTPNVYEGRLLLEDSLPKWNVTIPFTLTMQYASSVITQRWNDVLAIRNSDYNGGFVFDSVQWYVAGQPIEGARSFNYHTPGSNLRFGEEYTAYLWRNDGVGLFTCSFVPTKVDESQISNLPSLVKPHAPLTIQGKGTAYWYDLLGHGYDAQDYDNSAIYTPHTAGSYILLLRSEGTDKTAHVIVTP